MLKYLKVTQFRDYQRSNWWKHVGNNLKGRCIVTSSLIGWAHIQNDPCRSYLFCGAVAWSSSHWNVEYLYLIFPRKSYLSMTAVNYDINNVFILILDIFLWFPKHQCCYQRIWIQSSDHSKHNKEWTVCIILWLFWTWTLADILHTINTCVHSNFLVYSVFQTLHLWMACILYVGIVLTMYLQIYTQ